MKLQIVASATLVRPWETLLELSRGMRGRADWVTPQGGGLNSHFTHRLLRESRWREVRWQEVRWWEVR